MFEKDGLNKLLESISKRKTLIYYRWKYKHEQTCLRWWGEHSQLSKTDDGWKQPNWKCGNITGKGYSSNVVPEFYVQDLESCFALRSFHFGVLNDIFDRTIVLKFGSVFKAAQ